MSKTANPVRVGVFVVCGAIIVIIAVMIFGAMNLFGRTETVVCFFDDSVHGLDVGAPVKYKGVRIGKVDEINIVLWKEDLRVTRIEVVMSMDVVAIRRRVTSSAMPQGSFAFIGQIEDGLRAQLAFQSLVTGLLYVELDFFARPGEHYRLYDKYNRPEIPTVTSGLSDMAKKVESMMLDLSEINFKQLSDNLNTLLVNANEKIVALNTKQINEELVTTIASAREILQGADIKGTLKNFNLLLEDSRSMVSTTSKTVESLGEESKETMERFNEVLSHLNAILVPTSPFRYEFSLLMKNLSDTSLSIKALADYIERNPSAIITGRPPRAKENEKNEGKR